MKFYLQLLSFNFYSFYSANTMGLFKGSLFSIIFLPQVIFGVLLEPAKIYHEGIYRLEIQSEDKFLTSGGNGTGLRTRWANRQDQKWIFNSLKNSSTLDQQGWTLAPKNGNPGIPTLWKISYVGHGKFRFMSFASGLCLAGFGSNAVGERKCEKDSPYQRWLVLEVKNPVGKQEG